MRDPEQEPQNRFEMGWCDMHTECCAYCSFEHPHRRCAPDGACLPLLPPNFYGRHFFLPRKYKNQGNDLDGALWRTVRGPNHAEGASGVIKGWIYDISIESP